MRLKLIWYLILSPYSIMAVFIIRIISPWIIIRIGCLYSARIGHFASNTELYCLEKENKINTPIGIKVIDLFFLDQSVCNNQLKLMWSRKLNIYSRFFLAPIWRLNNIVDSILKSDPNKFQAGHTSQSDRDIFNLMNDSVPVLSLTADEEDRGQKLLAQLGVPSGADFVCLTIRDSAYLAVHYPNVDWSYHNYRNSDIADYALAAEALADNGIYVIRMGVKVKTRMPTKHPKIIDYPFREMRSEFLDIYLGAKCLFCISQGTGFDAVPIIFRRPVVYVNLVPVSYFNTFSKRSLGIFKHHISGSTGIELTFKEIFQSEADQFLTTSCFNEKNIILKNNTPEEILDVVLEMKDRIIKDLWSEGSQLTKEQILFWSLFPIHAVSKFNSNRLHGKIHALIGQKYLEENFGLL